MPTLRLALVFANVDEGSDAGTNGHDLAMDIKGERPVRRPLADMGDRPGLEPVRTEPRQGRRVELQRLDDPFHPHRLPGRGEGQGAQPSARGGRTGYGVAVRAGGGVAEQGDKASLHVV